MKRGREAIVPILFLTIIGLAGGGCAGAGMAAAGPLLTAIQSISARSVERTLSADLGTAWTAMADTFSRMELRITGADRDGEVWLLQGVGEAVTVYARLVPVTPQMTKVSLRAEAGALFADKQTAEEILDQVKLSLVPPPVVVEREPAPEQNILAEELAALEREIRHLKLTIEAKEKERVNLRPQSGPDEMTGTVSSSDSRIVIIPPSYAFPKPLSTFSVTDGLSPPVAPGKQAAVPADPRPETEVGNQETLAGPPVRADVLIPVPAMGGRHSPAIQPRVPQKDDEFLN